MTVARTSRHTSGAISLSIVALGALAPPLACGAEGPPANSVLIAMGRLSDCHFPGQVSFHISVDVQLADMSGVTGYAVTTEGGLSGSTLKNNNTEWDFDSLAEMKTGAQGTWVIQILGDSPSTSTFTVDVSSLQDSEIFTLPTSVSPVQDSIVCPSAVCMWTPPASGPYPALGYHIGIWHDGPWQGPDMEQTAAPDDGVTSWDPEGCMLSVSGNAGAVGAVIEVCYASMSASATASPLVVTEGAIEWGTSPLAPRGFPAQTPLILLTACQQSCFTLQPCMPADLNCDDRVDGADLGTLLGAWGQAAPGTAADFNHDGLVDGADLGVLLGAWTTS